MLRQHQLIDRLIKQRDMLDELISKVGEAKKLEGIDHLYDATTRQIQKNLLELRKSILNQPNNRRM